MKSDMTAEEIKRIRGKYQLTQRAFAQVLGLGEASVVRYENGEAPSKAIANLIRAADNPQFMSDCMKHDGSLLSDSQRTQTERIIYSLVTFDEKGEIMGMNEIYELTLKAEILNELAAELLADLFHLQRQASGRGDSFIASYYDDLSNRVALKKFDITTSGTDMKALCEIQGFLNGIRESVRIVEKVA